MALSQTKLSLAIAIFSKVAGKEFLFFIYVSLSMKSILNQYVFMCTFVDNAIFPEHHEETDAEEI